MENKLNIAELLKDCPQGMELDCVLYDDVTLECVSDDNCYPIKIHTPEYNILLNKYGCLTPSTHSKCVIFPKGKTTWEEFVLPCKFKDGEVVVAETKTNVPQQLFLLKCVEYCKDNNDYDGYCYFGWDFHDNRLFEEGIWGFNRLATEEEKQKLFDTINANGYRWDSKAKTLEKLIEPKFKVGDKIQHKNGYSLDVSILKINADCYTVKDFMGDQITIDFTHQDNYELVPNKFDITTLKPFDKVLARDNDSQKWDAELFSSYNNESEDYHFKLVGVCSARYCIPYEGNEHLLGTTNDCDNFYKTWKK